MKIASAKLSIFALGVAVASSTFAQTQAEAEAENAGLEEVVVTAEKVAVSAQKLSRSVNVINAEELQKTGTVKLTDALQNVMGVLPSAGRDFPAIRGVFGDLMSGAETPSPVGINVDGASTVGGITNGFNSFGAGGSGVTANLFDVERIEVIRGPTGTMQGQNSLGGSVNVITRKPELGVFNWNGGLQVGNFNQRTLTAGVNIPLFDTLALRVSGQKQSHDPFGWNIGTTGGAPNGTRSGQAYQDDVSARVRLLWQPIDNLSVIGTVSYSQQASSNYLEGDTTKQGADRYNVYRDGIQTENRTEGPDVWRYQAEVNWQTSWGFDVTFTPTYNVAKPNFIDPTSNFNGNEQKASYELNAKSNGDGKLQWVAGTYYEYTKLNATNGSRVTGGGDPNLTPNTNISPNDVYMLQYWAANGITNEALLFGSRTYPKRNSMALYGQLNYSWLDNFRTKFGMRWSQDNKGGSPKFTGYGVGLPAGGAAPIFYYNNNGTNVFYSGAGIPNQTTSPGIAWSCYNCSVAFYDQPYEFKAEDNPLNYSGAVEWDVQENKMVYLSVNTGYDQSGVQPNTIPASTYPAQKMISYALGAKTRFLDNRLQFNFELYANDYKNYRLQSNDTSALIYTAENGGTYVQPDVSQWQPGGSLAGLLPYAPLNGPGPNPNPARVSAGGRPIRLALAKFRTSGLDIDTTMLLTANDQVTVGFALMDNEFPAYTDRFGNSNYEGQRLAQSPLLSMRYSYQHTFNSVFGGKLAARMDSRYQSETWASNERTNFVTSQPVPEAAGPKGGLIDDFWTSDFYLNWNSDGGHWALNGFVKNVFDTVEWQGGLPVPGAASRVTDPRTYGVGVNVNF